MTHQEAYDLLIENANKYIEDLSQESLVKARKYAGACSRYFYQALKNFNKNLNLDCDCWEIPSFTKFKNLTITVSASDKTSLEFTDNLHVLHFSLNRFSPEFIITWKRQKLNWLINCTKNSIKKHYEEIELDKILLETLENNLKNI